MEGKKLKKEVKKLRKKNKELLEKIKILKKENRQDELTGLGNRKEFKKIGDRVIRKSKREQQAFCLVYVDLDNFKEINDNKGHKAGDEVLVSFSNLIKENLRPFDFGFRMGGDEFVIILDETKKKEAKKIIERLKGFIEINFSTGIVEANPLENKDIDLKNLKEKADKKMYQNKKKKSSR